MKLLLILLLAFIKAPESNGYPEWAQGLHSYADLYCDCVPSYLKTSAEEVTKNMKEA